jgi:hypothetical protein
MLGHDPQSFEPLFGSGPRRGVWPTIFTATESRQESRSRPGNRFNCFTASTESMARRDRASATDALANGCYFDLSLTPC